MTRGNAKDVEVKRRAPTAENAFSIAREAPPDTMVPLDLKKALGVLKHYLWLVIGVAAVTSALATYVAINTPPVFRAHGVIRFKDTQRAIAGELGDRSNEGLIGRTADPLFTQVEILKSLTLAASVVDSMPRLRMRAEGFAYDLIRLDPGVRTDTLRMDFTEQGVLARGRRDEAEAAYGEPVEVDGIEFLVSERPNEGNNGTLVVLPRDDAAAMLIANLQVQPRENTDVVDVAFEATDRVLAREVVNRFVEVFQTSNLLAAQQQSRVRREFLEGQLAIADSVLSDARLSLNAFRAGTQVASARASSPTEASRLGTIETRREELDADRRMYARLLTGLQDSSLTSNREELRAILASPGIASNAVVSQLYRTLEQYEATHDSLVTGEWARAATHPDVQSLDMLIESTETKLVRSVEGVVASLNARIGALDGVMTRNAAASQRLSATEAEQDRLNEQVEAARRNADRLQEEYQKAQIAEAVEVGQVEILDRAVTPQQPTGAGRLQIILFGLVLGLALGAGGAFMLDHLNTSFRGQDDVASTLRIPSLMVIPQINGRGRRRLKGRQSGLPDTDLVAISQIGSPTAEACRGLRTMLTFAGFGETMRVIAVTSALPEDGKTTVASNLAATFALQGQRVLLMDCDLRRGSLHKRLGVRRPQPGLMGLLAGTCAHGEAISGTKIDNLFLLPTGTLRGDASELLGDVQLKRVVGELRQAFDIIVMDTPPVLAVTDSLTASANADGVLLVVRAGRTGREVAQLAIRHLGDVGARVLGAVLNDPDGKVPQQGYYYYYYPGYQTSA